MSSETTTIGILTDLISDRRNRFEQNMETQERQFAINQLTSSEARILQLVDSLTPAQWYFHESPDRWSIAEILEHLIAFENFIRATVAQVLQGAPEPGKKPLAATREGLVLSLPDTRSTRFIAREVARPVGRWPGTVEMIAEFRKTRAQTLAFAAETPAALRDHFFPHLVFGDLDCYQWLVLLGRHAFRHAVQMEEIMAHPSYPVS
jgi:hypothetical protein